MNAVYHRKHHFASLRQKLTSFPILLKYLAFFSSIAHIVLKTKICEVLEMHMPRPRPQNNFMMMFMLMMMMDQNAFGGDSMMLLLMMMMMQPGGMIGMEA